MQRALRLLAWVNLVVCLGLFSAAAALYFANQPAPEWRQVYDLEVWTLFAWATLFPTVALLILVNQPRNVLGWLLAGIGFLTATTVLATQYAIFGLYTRPTNVLLPSVALWLRTWLWFPAICLLAFFLLLFPTGSLPSPRWRWVTGSLVLALAGSLAINFADLAQLPATFAGSPRAPLVAQIMSLILALLVIVLVTSILSLLLRWRGASAQVRQQIKWVVFAGLLFGAIFFLGDLVIAQIWQDDQVRLIAGNLAGAVAVTALVAGILVAILRYRLFDIDVIIRKTIQYTVVTGLLLVIYFGIVIILQQLFVRLTGQGSTAAVVLSTLAIAALFNPIRRRVQNAVDRRFFRQKYDAEQVMAQFAATARDETDLDALNAELLRVIQETMQPAHVSVWLKPTADGRPPTAAGRTTDDGRPMTV